MKLELLYHVPRSQVWEGSRGRQQGNTHVHVRDELHVGRIHRKPGEALCKRRAWYSRPPDSEPTWHGGPGELDRMCPRCVELAERLGLIVPR